MNSLTAAATLLLAFPLVGFAASITEVGLDEETNDAWRTTDVAKPFGDADNTYGTTGYLIAQYPDGNPNNVSQPFFGTIEVIGGSYEGVGAEPHQAAFDDVTATGPGPVPDLVCGDYWVNNTNHLSEDAFFTITLTEEASFRLGVITDQTPDNPAGLLWEASTGVRVTGPDGLDTGMIDLTDSRNADVDYLLFDIQGEAGDVFTIIGQNWFPSGPPNGWNANALGGLFVDPLPGGPEIASFAVSPNEIDTPGSVLEFSWEVEPPLDSLRLIPGDIDVLVHTNGEGAGSFTLDPGPNATTAYRLEATRGDESTTVVARVNMLPPEIHQFEADTQVVSPGGEVTFSWEISLPLTSLTLVPGDIDLLDFTDGNGLGSYTLENGPTVSTTYEIVAARGPATELIGELNVVVAIPGSGIFPLGVDEETNDAWRSSDISKPFGDTDNIYGSDGYLIAQLPDGDLRNQVNPPYATVQLVPGIAYEGVGAEPHQGRFDDVTLGGPGDVPDSVAGDYWLDHAGPTGTEHEFFTITLTQDASFRLGVITDMTPANPPALLWEAARGVRIVSSVGDDSGLVDAMGPGEVWRDADVDYVLFDISGKAGDVFTVMGEQDERWRANALGGVFFDPAPAGPGSGPRITEIRQDNGMLRISWESRKRMVYDLVSAIDPATARPIDWSAYGALADIEATPPLNSITIPLPPEDQRFFAVRQRPEPPATLLDDNFEGGPGQWTTGSDGIGEDTAWEHGTPAIAANGPLSAHSVPSCFGTNITGDYGAQANVWLRSPVIDLTDEPAATLRFVQFVDIDDFAGAHQGTINILDATDDSFLAQLESGINGIAPTWTPRALALPAEALGRQIKVEFRFESDQFASFFAGWYLDDLQVTVP